MAQVNPNDVASAGVQALQGAIATLDALKLQPDPDIPGIDAQINALQAQQAGLRNQVLRSIEDSAANKQAIAAMNAAAASLKTAAATMQVTAANLANVAKVVTAAASLVAALAPFV
jgi:hypothetical protein